MIGQYSPPGQGLDTHPYRVLIIGSCVTRDVFRSFGEGVIISDYFARTSIPSLVSQPLEYDSMQISLGSEFQRRNVKRDMEKTLWARMEKRDYDFVLIDLIDERFDLLKSGDSIITKSNELVASGFLEQNSERFLNIPKMQYEIDQWKVDCEKFGRLSRRLISFDRVVIIRAFWATHYKDHEGKLRQFDEKTKFPYEYVNMSNKKLVSLYHELEMAFLGANIINLQEPIADYNHIWGLSPFHYSIDWYRSCREKLDDIVYNFKNFNPIVFG